ncbi:MAG: hypothetical protein IPK80_00895 [Nannocystis sp.]|nr:hypothetical protein [Nannocystis sp.]
MQSWSAAQHSSPQTLSGSHAPVSLSLSVTVTCPVVVAVPLALVLASDSEALPAVIVPESVPLAELVESVPLSVTELVPAGPWLVIDAPLEAVSLPLLVSSPLQAIGPTSATTPTNTHFLLPTKIPSSIISPRYQRIPATAPHGLHCARSAHCRPKPSPARSLALPRARSSLRRSRA